MKKIIALMLTAWFCNFTLLAQDYFVKGKVLDGQSQEPIEFATAALLRNDSSLVGGIRTDESGSFCLKAKYAGPYILKLSFMGYLTLYQNLQWKEGDKVCDLGMLRLKHDDHLLGTATVTATAAKVEQVEDTTMYNAAAYRVPEGSTLEAIVKQLPGIEIEDDGTITWNGKQIKEFLVNGKDFFKGQMDIALQNLPSDWVSKIKAYEKQSDFAEQTGIEDGEEIPVLDIVTKRELNQTLIANTDVSYGTEKRYFAKLFLSRFTDHSRVSAYGSANNVSDKSFGGKRKRQGGGLVARKNAGSDFFWNNGKQKREAGKLELGGNINYNHTSSDLLSTMESENYLASGSTRSFRCSQTQNDASSTNFSAALRLDWNPDTMTNIQFRPAFNHGESRNGGNSRTATFNDDPFRIPGMGSPLDSLDTEWGCHELDSMLVNQNLRESKGNRMNNAFNGSLNVVRRLNSKGRSLSFAFSGGYQNNENENFSLSTIRYYNGRLDKFLNQYSHVPSNNWNYRLLVGYVEPITKSWFAELHYAYGNKYNESDRARYNLEQIDSIYGNWYDSQNPPMIGTLPEDTVLMGVRDSNNSQFATYRYYDHNANLNIRYSTKEVRFTAGVNFNPERTRMAYERPGQHLDTVITRKVFKITPQFRLRYRFDKRNSLEARYRGSSSQPSMTELLAVVDNSHPLNVTMGNPGLDPSWNNAFDLGYRGYQTERQQGMAAGFGFSQTKHAVSRLTVYDESTGVRYHRPQNIDGNWNLRSNYMFNTGLGKKKNFTLSTNTNLLFNHAVGYISSFSSGAEFPSGVSQQGSEYGSYDEIFANANIQKNTTKTLGVRERLNFAYRKEGWEVGTFGSVNYTHSRADKRARNDRDTWNYGYGLNTNIKFNFGLSLSTDIRVNSRRGYPNATMNTDEWLWNAQIAYSFLKRKAATISLQCYDILQQQSNVSHAISATHRSDSWNNDIHSYYMLHFIYKFRHIGGKARKSSWQKNKSWKNKNKSILDEDNELPSDTMVM